MSVGGKKLHRRTRYNSLREAQAQNLVEQTAVYFTGRARFTHLVRANTGPCVSRPDLIAEYQKRLNNE